MKKPVVILLFISLALGCSDFFANENKTPVVAAFFEGDELIIRNGLDEPIYYFAVNQNSLALILWAPFVGPDTEVKAGKAKSIPVTNIDGYEDDEPVVVHYWDAEVSEIHVIVLE
jgi:hypothetical protein